MRATKATISPQAGAAISPLPPSPRKAAYDAVEFRTLPPHLRSDADRKLRACHAELGGNVEIYAKREDCNSGLAFGGNKLRKLEYIVPDYHRLAAPTRSSR